MGRRSIMKNKHIEKIQECEDKAPFFDERMLSSSHINFLFGSGINGDVIPQIDDCEEALNLIKEYGGDISKGLESAIDNLDNPEDREEVKKCFIKELKEKYNEYKSNPEAEKDESIVNLKTLMRETHSIVKMSENRTKSMQQINIYTLNYDDVLEDVINGLGVFSSSVSASNVNEKSALFDMVGYNYMTGKTTPMFMISKLHGDMDNPILPGREKYREVLNEDYFEIVYNMKEKLSRNNSILIVIGYSGRDEHINKVLKDCVDRGLVIYWYKYVEGDKTIRDEQLPIHVWGPRKKEEIQDTTKKCYEDMREIWKEK